MHGATDELGCDIVGGQAAVRDLQTTVLHLLGLDAPRLSYRYQGLDQRLIGPSGEGTVMQAVLG
jgi:hypothetical protein